MFLLVQDQISSLCFVFFFFSWRSNIALDDTRFLKCMPSSLWLSFSLHLDVSSL